MIRSWVGAGAVIAVIFVGACARQAQESPAAPVGQGPTGAGAPMAMCAPDVPDCVDTVVVDEGGDVFDSEQARADARELLGKSEADLDGGVRVARRGDEHMALTDDYVLGRMTVELDEDGGAYHVVAVTVELPEGPQTFRK